MMKCTHQPGAGAGPGPSPDLGPGPGTGPRSEETPSFLKCVVKTIFPEYQRKQFKNKTKKHQ